MDNKDLVVVTGASGFIAQHTIKILLEKGYAVRGTVRDLGRIERLTASLAGQCDVTNLSFAKADLSTDEGWDTALSGAKYLLHMASPLPVEQPEDEDELIIPARDGALRALKAAVAAQVSRIVMTSSIASVSGGLDTTATFDESHWSDVTQDIGPYPKSKTIAERAAWDYINSLPEDNRPELVMINPGFVLGPLIDPDTSASHEVVRRLLSGQVPGIPDIGFSLVDVRDVAVAHVAALTADEAPGNRYICVTGYRDYYDIAKQVHTHLAGSDFKVPLRRIPSWLVRILANFNPTLKLIVPRLGQVSQFDTTRIRQDLQWQPIDLDTSLIETVDSLIEHKIV
ncbi:aldehyde reductase [Sneathiella marina]|uniref:Aldehyde reductase n=1 Tax=Sneathiella marina TaxID=2950108 RepID=A0ABY4W4Y0_9PROT|nr:aldehyde reductase [Sneathiella marina]USG60349.1 aldehyde reductase [Sneathiella marina]